MVLKLNYISVMLKGYKFAMKALASICPVFYSPYECKSGDMNNIKIIPWKVCVSWTIFTVRFWKKTWNKNNFILRLFALKKTTN